MKLTKETLINIIKEELLKINELDDDLDMKTMAENLGLEGVVNVLEAMAAEDPEFADKFRLGYDIEIKS